jgi:hypothetical protein
MFACAVIAGSYFTGYTGVYFLIPAIILVTAYVYLLASRKMRWRYRDILELAAKPVEETQDGFTTRPFPAGVAEYTREELIRFGNYLSKNLIAFPFIEKERILFLINGTTRFLFRRPNAQQDTFVTFDFKGNIAVNIAKNDYKKYKAELTFDQLCASLGSLFKTFLQFYQEGKKDRIIPMIEEYVSRIHNARPEPDPSTQIKTESKSGNHAGH